MVGDVGRFPHPDPCPWSSRDYRLSPSIQVVLFHGSSVRRSLPVFSHAGFRFRTVFPEFWGWHCGLEQRGSMWDEALECSTLALQLPPADASLVQN